MQLKPDFRIQVSFGLISVLLEQLETILRYKETKHHPERLIRHTHKAHEIALTVQYATKRYKEFL